MVAYPPAPQYPQEPAPHGPRTRPTAVTAAVWIQFVTAAALIASGLASLTTVDVVIDGMVKSLENDPSFTQSGMDPADFGDFFKVFLYGSIGIYVVFAAFYVILGLFNNRGKRASRVLSWILSGIALMCCGLGQLIGTAGQFATTGAEGREYNDELTRAVEDATPLWATVMNWIALTCFIAGSLAIIILLSVPAANEFFRKPDPTAGVYPYGQPGMPMAPGAPGTPAAAPGTPPPAAPQPPADPAGQQPPGAPQPPAAPPSTPPAGEQPPSGPPAPPAP